VAATDALSIPVILGTPRRGRQSVHPARFVLGRLALRDGVETELIDVAAMRLPVDDAGEQIKDPAFAARMARADGLVLVTPEYNHSFPGLMKHLLDSCLEEYIHKAAGIVGVSAGPWGGTRVVQSMLPVLRELGLVCTYTDVQFANVEDAFDASGELREQAFVRRVDVFLDELIWMSRTLRHGRRHFPQD
jgi:NAD(P)H-dependent FMN reductase